VQRQLRPRAWTPGRVGRVRLEPASLPSPNRLDGRARAAMDSPPSAPAARAQASPAASPTLTPLPPSAAAPSAAAAAPATATATTLESWLVFNLNGKRATLDEEGLLIARRQDVSAQSRKELAVSTRTFKRSKLPGEDATPEQVVAAGKAFTALLKQYQSEVDSLTSRAKASEAAFLALYKGLYEVPDPVADLRHAAADRATAAQLREEMRAMRAEHSGLAERSAAAREYESRIETLEAANKTLAARAGEQAKAHAEEKQAQWMAAQRKAIEAYELREQELLHQLSVANDALRSQQVGADALKGQLDDAMAQLDGVKKARAAGVEMMAEDGVRARDEVNDLRRRCSQLEALVAGLSGDEGGAGDGGGDDGPEVAGGRGIGGDARRRASGPLVGRSALSAELAAREVEVSQLKDQVTALEEVLTGKDAAKSTEFARLARSIEAKDEQIGELTEAVDQLPTLGEYETMRRQFEALKDFQLNESSTDAGEEVTSSVSSATGAGGEAAGADDAARGGGPACGPRPSADLERRLLAKLKAMESKSTALRVELAGKDSRLQELSLLVRSLEERNDDQKSLIAKLEDGINVMTGDPASARSMKTRLSLGVCGADSAGPYSPSASSAADDGGAGGGAGENGVAAGGGDGSGAWDWGEQQQAAGLQRIIREEPTMLDIVAGQRDRFRTRTLELETESQKVSERLERVTADMDRLKTDNVRLYEKIRYLQSYTQSSGSRNAGSNSDAGAASGAADGPPSTSGSVVLGVEEDDGAAGFLNQYRSMYEEMVNPYTLFNRRERHKRISEMSAPERLTLRATQRAVSTKTSRLFVFTYMLCLHVLVFAVLGFASSSPSCPEADITTKAQH
jgi:homeobox protein cut-like